MSFWRKDPIFFQLFSLCQNSQAEGQFWSALGSDVLYPKVGKLQHGLLILLVGTIP